MKLSKMFGVERGEKFMVEGGGKTLCKIIAAEDNVEYLLVKFAEKHRWEVARIDALLAVISLAPDGIIHLPPPLTDEQRVVLMSLFTIGARYMGMSREGWKRCFVNKPKKEFSGWTCGDTQALTIGHGMANCLDSLVSWSDPEPFDIGKALGADSDSDSDSDRESGQQNGKN